MIIKQMIRYDRDIYPEAWTLVSQQSRRYSEAIRESVIR